MNKTVSRETKAMPVQYSHEHRSLSISASQHGSPEHVVNARLRRGMSVACSVLRSRHQTIMRWLPDLQNQAKAMQQRCVSSAQIVVYTAITSVYHRDHHAKSAHRAMPDCCHLLCHPYLPAHLLCCYRLCRPCRPYRRRHRLRD